MILPFQNTSIYKVTKEIINPISDYFHKLKISPLSEQIESETINIITNIAKALSKETKAETEQKFSDAVENIFSLVALIDVAESQELIAQPHKDTFTKELNELIHTIRNFENRRKKIMILSAEIGQGHMSASKAVKEAIEYKYGYDYDVEIVDFIELLDSIVNVITKKNYENLVKFAPSIYKFIYESSNKQIQVVKLLNQFNYPFVLSKFTKYFEEKQPDILISTFPVWNYLTAEIWKKHNKDAKFISIVTDSISIHQGWIIADTDYHIVANQDTADAMIDLGIEKEKIKTLGFPVRLSFLDQVNRKNVLGELNLNPEKFTVLFLPTSVNLRKTARIIKELSTFEDDINVVIVTGRDLKLKPKIEKLKSITPGMRVIGWTDKMHDYIKASDLVITKAGGATLMECIAATKPVIITSIIPGQEQGNAELVKKYSLGIVATQDKPEIADHVKYIQQKQEYFTQNIGKLSNPSAALKIAEFIHEVL